MRENICLGNIREIYKFRQYTFNGKKKEVMDMLYRYKEAFSLRDEIGTSPNIEVGIDMTDKSPFFIRPYNVREEDIK